MADFNFFYCKIPNMHNDEYWMKIALQEASLAMKENEIPVGAVIVQNGKLIAKAHNQSINNNDPTAHAEIQVIRQAGIRLNNYRLKGTSLYVTLEPCAMCFGALVHARVGKIFFGAKDPKTGVCGTAENFTNLNSFNHKIEIKSKLLDKECGILLQSFFMSKR